MNILILDVNDLSKHSGGTNEHELGIIKVKFICAINHVMIKRTQRMFFFLVKMFVYFTNGEKKVVDFIFRRVFLI